MVQLRQVFYAVFPKFIANGTYLVSINVLGHIVSVSLVAFGFLGSAFREKLSVHDTAGIIDDSLHVT